MKYLVLILMTVGLSQSALAGSESCFLKDENLEAKITSRLPDIEGLKFQKLTELMPGGDSKFWALDFKERNRLFFEVARPLEHLNIERGKSACSPTVQFTYLNEATKVVEEAECLIGIVITQDNVSHFKIGECQRFTDNKRLAERLNSVSSEK